MKKVTIAIVCFMLMSYGSQVIPAIAAVQPTFLPERIQEKQEQVQQQTNQVRTAAEDGNVRENAYRSGRGGFSRGGVSRAPGAGYTTGPRTPTNRVTTPNTSPYPRGGTGFGTGLGGLFGGFAAGALLGSLFNPFGFGGGYGYGTGGISWFGLLFWAVIIYMGYRLFRRMRDGYRR